MCILGYSSSNCSLDKYCTAVALHLRANDYSGNGRWVWSTRPRRGDLKLVCANYAGTTFNYVYVCQSVDGCSPTVKGSGVRSPSLSWAWKGMGAKGGLVPPPSQPIPPPPHFLYHLVLTTLFLVIKHTRFLNATPNPSLLLKPFLLLDDLRVLEPSANIFRLI